MRVITSQGDKDFGSNVTVNLNNQNRIKSSFLRSNDPRVVQLANSLFTLQWFLERRENEVVGFSQDERIAIEHTIGKALEGRVISLEEGTRAYVSTYLQKPELAKKSPKQMFEGVRDGGQFESIFDTGISAEKFVIAFQTRRCVEGFLRQLSNSKRKKARGVNCDKEFVALLGVDLLAKQPDKMEALTLSGTEFLCAIVFASLGEKTPDSLLSELQTGDFTALKDSLSLIFDFAAARPTEARKRWSTLFQSQTFFERVVNYSRQRKLAST